MRAPSRVLCDMETIERDLERPSSQIFFRLRLRHRNDSVCAVGREEATDMGRLHEPIKKPFEDFSRVEACHLSAGGRCGKLVRKNVVIELAKERDGLIRWALTNRDHRTKPRPRLCITHSTPRFH